MTATEQPARPLPTIFVSYRRDDMGSAAAPIATMLKQHISTDGVFFDRADIEGGDDWLDRLDAGVEERDAFLALIGPKWEGRTESGRRIDEPDDYVRREVRTSLRRRLRQYPVLVDRGSDDFPSFLPPDIAPLGSVAAFELRQQEFENHFAAIVVRIWTDHLRLHRMDAVLTIGTIDLDSDAFLSYLGRRKHGSETLFVTRATVQHGVLYARDVTGDATPTLKCFIDEHASDDERRFAVAVAGIVGWDRIIVVTGAATAGVLGVEQLAGDGHDDWLAELADRTSSGVEVVNPSDAAGAAGRIGRRWKSASTTTKAGAVLVPAAGVVAVAALWPAPDDGPALAGVWDTSGFAVAVEAAPVENFEPLPSARIEFVPVERTCEGAGCTVVVETGPSFMLGAEIGGAPDYDITFGRSDFETITELGGVACVNAAGEVIRPLSDVATVEFDASTIDGDSDRLRLEVEVSVGDVDGMIDTCQNFSVTWVSTAERVS